MDHTISKIFAAKRQICVNEGSETALDNQIDSLVAGISEKTLRNKNWGNRILNIFGKLRFTADLQAFLWKNRSKNGKIRIFPNRPRIGCRCHTRRSKCPAAPTHLFRSIHEHQHGC